MDDTSSVDTVVEISSMAGAIHTTILETWRNFFTLAKLRTIGVKESSFVTLLALILPFVLLWAIKKYEKIQDTKKKSFPFLNLPQELRDMVYEELLENPTYPAPPACTKHSPRIKWSLPIPWLSNPSNPKHHKPSNWIFLTNKQIHNEYMEYLCKRTTFHLTVSPENFLPPPPPSSQPHHHSHPSPKIWPISTNTLTHLRSCSLHLITTSSMLGVSDPRTMTSRDWPLAARIRTQLSSLTSVTSLSLDAKAIGDPLWNPLWIWYHASQSFKHMGTPLSDTSPNGPRLNRITFSLDTWSPGENYLQREGGRGVWMWYCMKGHLVGADGGVDMTVREFCGRLYQDCRICRPEEEWESGGETEDEEGGL